jgi:hypothetical protein
MTVIIYSVNIGGYDFFNNPKIIDPNVRYILFTDNKFFKSNVWEVYHIDFVDNNLNNRLKARYIKTNPHKILPKHDISIWVDHCFTPKIKDVYQVFNTIGFMDNDIMCYSHDERNCLYNEAKIVKQLSLEDPTVIDNQMNKYKNEGFPDKLGLFQSGFMFRKNNLNVNKFNDTWWVEIKNGSGRDQLSQVYSSWKNSINITPINNNGSVYNNKFLSVKTKHIHKHNNNK